ncbi:MAG: T9SS type A sorting domain-containing protein [Bacteroidales bacterium]|nr:T9SS type A sorting domain-containing protein [Bacteroidales bacterium]
MYLGINYISPGGDFEVNELTGNENTFMSDLNYGYFGGTDPHYNVDILGANFGTDTLFSSEEGNARLFLKEMPSHKVISSSVVLGAMANGNYLNLKPYLVSEIINYFLDFSPATSLKENLSNILTTGKNYPNPFSYSTNIDYTLNESGNVRIEIFNAKGQIIKVLVDEGQLQGNYSVKWNTTDNNGNFLDNGFYFYKIRTGNLTISEKMILLK